MKAEVSKDGVESGYGLGFGVWGVGFRVGVWGVGLRVRV